MNLFEINKAIEELIDLETGEILDLEKLDQLNLKRKDKLDNILFVIKNLSADKEQLASLIKEFKEKETALDNNIKRLKDYLATSLNGEKYSNSYFKVYYGKTTAVEITDEVVIPSMYLRYDKPKILKTDIKNALKAGKDVAGCRLVENTHMVIK